MSRTNPGVVRAVANLERAHQPDLDGHGVVVVCVVAWGRGGDEGERHLIELNVLGSDVNGFSVFDVVTHQKVLLLLPARIARHAGTEAVESDAAAPVNEDHQVDCAALLSHRRRRLPRRAGGEQLPLCLQETRTKRKRRVAEEATESQGRSAQPKKKGGGKGPQEKKTGSPPKLAPGESPSRRSKPASRRVASTSAACCQHG